MTEGNGSWGSGVTGSCGSAGGGCGPALQPAPAHRLGNFINISVKSIYTQSMHRESHKGSAVL